MTDTYIFTRDELQAALDALAKTREELRACQAVIHLAGGFDPAYVTGAKAAMKLADESTETLRARLAQQEEKPTPRMYLYDFPNPDDPNEVVHDWTADTLEEIALNNGFNVRPLYTTPTRKEEKAADPCVDGSCDCCWADKEPEPVAWDVFVKHSYIYFSIGNQSFQLAMAPEDEPDMSAGQIAAWYMTQLRNALARLASTLPPHRPWQGLTDEEIRNEANHHVFDESFFNGAVWARGKIKEKNNG